MKVVIAGNFWFPHGSASAARVRNLALGLRECGASVHVITMPPYPRIGGTDSSGRGTYQGVSYESASPLVANVDGWRDADHTVPRLRRGLRESVRWFAGLYAATPAVCGCIRERIENGECDLVIACDRSAVRMTPLAKTCRAAGVTSILDVVEVSEQMGGSRMSAIYWDSRRGTRTTPRLFDGLTVITAGLDTLYRNQGCADRLIVPAIDEWPPAPAPLPTGNAVFRLTYVGALQPRDAPELLIEALRILCRRRVPIEVEVIGHYEGTAAGTRLARACSEDLDLSRIVRLRGSLSDAALAAHLAGSDGLVLTRRAARTEELAFPTRLVEYLRTARPVFVADVGDVSLYLRDGIDAVLLDPRDPRRVADAIGAVVKQPDRGLEIGKRGREAGRRSFDRRRHAARLLDFAGSLRRQRAS